MPPFRPNEREDLIHYLRRAGFDAPKSGGKHQYLKRGLVEITLPNPHSDDVGKSLLARKNLRDALISQEE
jgi:hypothetical protein